LSYSTPWSTEVKLLVDLYQMHDVIWKVDHPNHTLAR